MYLLDTNVLIELLRNNAAMALVNNAILVTDNVSHFKRVVGLKLENWTR
ncbi:MAG: hypothetical protein K6T71_04805 [Candidatus Bipolaricaulota bacterium]|nr:hypothetical protein [Candidatus Bipolaricaulota bacterium]